MVLDQCHFRLVHRNRLLAFLGIVSHVGRRRKRRWDHCMCRVPWWQRCSVTICFVLHAILMCSFHFSNTTETSMLAILLCCRQNYICSSLCSFYFCNTTGTSMSAILPCCIQNYICSSSVSICFVPLGMFSTCTTKFPRLRWLLSHARITQRETQNSCDDLKTTSPMSGGYRMLFILRVLWGWARDTFLFVHVI